MYELEFVSKLNTAKQPKTTIQQNWQLKRKRDDGVESDNGKVIFSLLYIQQTACSPFFLSKSIQFSSQPLPSEQELERSALQMWLVLIPASTIANNIVLAVYIHVFNGKKVFLVSLMIKPCFLSPSTSLPSSVGQCHRQYQIQVYIPAFNSELFTLTSLYSPD